MTSLQRDLTSRRFWRKFLGYLLGGIGGFATFLQVYDVIDPDTIGDEDFPVWLPVLVFSAIGAAIAAWPRPVQQQYSRPNTAIHVVEGDLFDQPIDLVIGMADTFDTEVPTVIAATSVQAQLVNRAFGSNVGEFDSELQAALAPMASIGTVKKPGKQTRYPLGTTAVLHHGGRRIYCVAYTTMNERNEARGTVDGVWESLNSLWRSVSECSNGGPVAISVIGGGQSRLSQILPAQDAIRLTALSFMLASRRERVCSRLDVVVRREDAGQLDMPELQAFLSSLQ